MPHPSAWGRVLDDAIDGAELEPALSAFCREQQAAAEVPACGNSILALDGTTVCGMIPAGQTRGVHLLAVDWPDQGVTLAPVAVVQQENEMVAVPTLPQRLDLTEVVVTGDAMQTQRTLCRQIGDAQGDDCWLVKENQPDLLASLELRFERPRLAAGWSDPMTDSQRPARWSKSMDA